MSHFDVSDSDVDYVQCAVCEKAISGRKWFARISCGSKIVALCCPLCAEVFEKSPRAYVRRIETIELLEEPDGPFRREGEQS